MANRAVTEPRLYGRSADLARLLAALQGRRGCVSLIGMAGVGKSSLARWAQARWPEHSAWVDLAALSQADQVAGAIARALEVHLDDGHNAAQRLRRLPQGPLLLLVLDNAEHLISACADWAAHLRAAPQLQLLVTSQIPLGISGEQQLRLAPLPLAAASCAATASAGAADDALALMVDRISAADSRFRLTDTTLPLLRTLCEQLDGLPLALEMAAARVPLMGLKAVVEALDQRFALLSRGRRDSTARHRSVHDALDWSYGLLAAPEQALFRTLGVFAGGFTLELAVALSSDEHVGRWDVVDGLATLVERSLVSVSPGPGAEDPPRYRLLETLRDYARVKWQGSGAAEQAASLQRRHASAVLAHVMAAKTDAQCLPEMENTRAAFLWAREHAPALAVQLCARVAGLILFTAWRQEVTDWMLSLQPLLQGPSGQALPAHIQASGWLRLAHVLNVRRDPAAQAAARQAVALWRDLNDAAQHQAALVHLVRAIGQPGAAQDEACAQLQQSAAVGVASPLDELRVHGALAEAANVRGDHQALLACREQELRLARELGWSAMAQAAETNICAALIELGRHAQAAERARALLQRIDAAGSAHNANLAWALYMLGECCVRLGDFDQARTLVRRSLAADQQFGISKAWLWILPLVQAQQPVASLGCLLGYLQRLWTQGSEPITAQEQALLAQMDAAVQAALGSDGASALAAEGRSLDQDGAVALVLGGSG